jgi:hypothetical protein
MLTQQMKFNEYWQSFEQNMHFLPSDYCVKAVYSKTYEEISTVPPLKLENQTKKNVIHAINTSMSVRDKGTTGISCARVPASQYRGLAKTTLKHTTSYLRVLKRVKQHDQV